VAPSEISLDNVATCSGQPCEFKLIFIEEASDTVRPLEQVEEREAIYKSGSKAKRGRTASSFLVIQASLDYPRNSRPWKSRLLRNLGNRYAIPTFPQPYCCGYF
jgi:hypothetical protein